MTYTEKYIKYDFSSLLVILLIIVGLSPVFSREIGTEMNVLSKTMVNGGIKTTIAKLSASIFFVFILTIWFAANDLIFFNFTFPMDGFSLPIFAVKSYQLSIFSGSIITFLILNLAARFLAFLVIALITLIISSFLKEEGIVFCISVVIVAFLIIACGYLPESFSALKLLNPMRLLTLRGMIAKYDSVCFGEKTILTAYISIISTVIIFVILFSAVVFVNRTNLKFGFNSYGRKRRTNDDRV